MIQRLIFVVLALGSGVGSAVGPVVALAQGAGSKSAYVGRPIYSEPASGLQMPPGCQMQPSWRARLGTSDHEVWVVKCSEVPRVWLLKRSVVEMIRANQARLRFQILDERVWPDEQPGETLSVQCVGRAQQDSGYVVVGAKWRTQAGKGGEVALVSAQTVLRADLSTQKWVEARIQDVECARYPEREAMMLRLQQSQK